MRWNQGRDAIEQLLADRELERVPASSAPMIYSADVREDIAKTDAIIKIATTMLDQMSPF